MPAKEQRYFSVKRSIEELTGTQVHMPSRLDVSTEGILILSLSTQAHAPLQQAFERRMVEKIYAFATHVEPSWKEYLATWRIGRDEHHAVLRRVVEKGGDEATTRFLIRKRASETSDLTVVEARPLTGRTHQIRVHARHLGIPVAGDNFYGGQAASGLHLLSRRISITHPVLKSPLSVVVPEELLPVWARGIDWKE
jgi:23S rRNA-/tRNA-specific pseudouridylate synthase